ncbi:heme exporter protein CcmD [Stenotrophomonas sp. 24(2023)]|uniref:heme exporter protein CcmD n=1 Tax=Stenotrophomonas sp. 24(2023) TaxID=3068324 RepID=UPI0027E008C7|nr:heme exporter protein CcmD [Stenotrophomonas sp. 24(2023)]WMJ69818.1 heme exporter protein CcmD [Stenotrophomonas sp. 24(2023)]
MNYLGYVVAAYAVFVGVLGADALGSWLRLRWAVTAAQRRQQRQRARGDAGTPASGELSR